MNISAENTTTNADEVSMNNAAGDAMMKYLFDGLAADLRTNHPEEAEHLQHTVESTGSLVDAILDSGSKLWGAIPIEILDLTKQGRDYLTIIDTFVKDETAVRALKSDDGDRPVAEVSGYLADVLGMDVFANVDPMALLADEAKLREFAESVQKVVDDGSLDMFKLEEEMQKLMNPENMAELTSELSHMEQALSVFADSQNLHVLD